MMSMTIDHKDVIQDMKRFGLDLRKSARRIIKNISEEIVEESIARVEKHRVTGDMVSQIYEYPETAWKRMVVFGDSSYLDSGTDPHGMPPKEAAAMAKHYGMNKHHLWNYVKKHGTKAHPFIDESYYTVINRIDDIMRRELERVR